MPKVKLVKGVRYKDGHGAGGDLPRDFTELAGDLDVEEAENTPPQPTLNTSVPAESSAGKPIIEEMPDPRRKAQQAVKKGFLNRNEKPLYPEGSKEGVLPENAGDPMGWMPKGLRQKSKIVDCNSPEYQAHQKQVEAAQESNRVNQEFKNLIDSDLFAATKRDKQSIWSEDRPDSVEDAARALPDTSEPRPNNEPLQQTVHDWLLALVRELPPDWLSLALPSCGQKSFSIEVLRRQEQGAHAACLRSWGQQAHVQVSFSSSSFAAIACHCKEVAARAAASAGSSAGQVACYSKMRSSTS
eukprot:719948-Amphidinium_carterae.1